MFKFKQVLSTKNITPWVNQCKYIVIHHTATWENTIKWVLNTLTTGTVSCHFVVDTNWDAYKIWEPKNILWHAWVSEWKWLQNLNQFSLWIEVIWPIKDWWFTKQQKDTVRNLVQHLMGSFWIPRTNVLRHKDIAPWRKTDIADTFWNSEYKDWTWYQDSLIPKII